MGKIITIGREFGSGGREVGQRLSDELGIAYYDNEIITEIAKRTELAEGYVQHVMENGPTALMPITIGRTFYMGADPVMEQNNAIYREQSLLVQELAEKSDCVIVGRSADYILRDKKPLRLFIYADMESRMERCRKRAPEQEHFTDKELRRHIQDVDKSRSKQTGGTGLGLAIVKEIIHAHHENINVISTEGVGTEFIFTLPYAENEN